MNINDLMLDNIILRKGVNNQWLPIKVTLPLLSDIQEHPDLYMPLEITREFLIKNFGDDTPDIYYLKINNEIGEALFYNLRVKAIVYKPSKDEWCVSLDMPFVHTLQNFIKVIGITKEFTI